MLSRNSRFLRALKPASRDECRECHQKIDTINFNGNNDTVDRKVETNEDSDRLHQVKPPVPLVEHDHDIGEPNREGQSEIVTGMHSEEKSNSNESGIPYCVGEYPQTRNDEI